MKFQHLKIQNVTCKGFIKTLSSMLINLDGVQSVEIDYKDTEVCFEIYSDIPKEKLMQKLTTSNSTADGKVKSCKKCVLEKLKNI